MLMMRETPKISDRPTATKNRPEAVESPLSAWNRKASRVMARYRSPRAVRGRSERSEKRVRLEIAPELTRLAELLATLCSRGDGEERLTLINPSPGAAS